MLCLSTSYPRDARRPPSASALSNSPHSKATDLVLRVATRRPTTIGGVPRVRFLSNSCRSLLSTLRLTVIDGESCAGALNLLCTASFDTPAQQSLAACLAFVSSATLAAPKAEAALYCYVMRLAPLGGVSCASGLSISPLSAPAAAAAAYGCSRRKRLAVIDGGSCETFFISRFRHARQTILGSVPCVRLLRLCTATSCALHRGTASPALMPSASAHRPLRRQRRLQPALSTHTPNID